MRGLPSVAASATRSGSLTGACATAPAVAPGGCSFSRSIVWTNDTASSSAGTTNATRHPPKTERSSPTTAMAMAEPSVRLVPEDAHREAAPLDRKPAARRS